jgi:hypothetical protein
LQSEIHALTLALLSNENFLIGVQIQQENDMLFSTEYPDYQDPIGEEHESQPHPIFQGLKKVAGYLGDFFALLFVTAFTGLELAFVMALLMLALQALTNISNMSDAPAQAWQSNAE